MFTFLGAILLLLKINAEIVFYNRNPMKVTSWLTVHHPLKFLLMKKAFREILCCWAARTFKDLDTTQKKTVKATYSEASWVAVAHTCIRNRMPWVLLSSSGAGAFVKDLVV